MIVSTGILSLWAPSSINEQISQYVFCLWLNVICNDNFPISVFEGNETVTPFEYGLVSTYKSPLWVFLQ